MFELTGREIGFKLTSQYSKSIYAKGDPVTTLDHIEHAAPRPRASAANFTAGPVFAVEAARIQGPRGPVFGPLDASSQHNITVVLGASGSGRTSLLLALSGRMRLQSGTLEVQGETETRAIRRHTGIAGFSEIDALEPSVTLAATLRERLSWELPWYRFTPRITADIARELLGPTFGTAAYPDPAQLCRELTPVDDLLARVALALIAQPSLIVVDDFDSVRDPAGRASVATRLAQLGIPVVVATSDPGDVGLFDEPATIQL